MYTCMCVYVCVSLYRYITKVPQTLLTRQDLLPRHRFLLHTPALPLSSRPVSII